MVPRIKYSEGKIVLQSDVQVELLWDPTQEKAEHQHNNNTLKVARRKAAVSTVKRHKYIIEITCYSDFRSLCDLRLRNVINLRIAILISYPNPDK